MAEHRVKGLAFASVYVDDCERAYEFYAGVLGLEKEYDMGGAACFFKLPDNTGLYLQGKNKTVSYEVETMRSASVFAVESAGATHERLKAAGVRFIHNEPRHMGGEQYWFQFHDQRATSSKSSAGSSGEERQRWTLGRQLPSIAHPCWPCGLRLWSSGWGSAVTRRRR